MLMKNPFKYKILFLAFLLSSCQTWDNASTYFNTFYNANRLKNESEDDFAYADEKKRVYPRALTPEDSTLDFTQKPTGQPPFMKDYIITAQKLQPVQVKVDSIIIKGSKILALHPKSDLVENTLYLMGLAYFYRSEWLPSEIKCSEMIDKFPEGDFSPDGHLLISKNLLVQRKYTSAKNYLSKTIDVAWHKNRYDILSEAFKLYSELAIYQRDFDEAVRPYLQAIIKCEDGEVRARWEVDLGAILYRLSRFETAKKMFEKALEDSPDYLNYFEANLYIASCNFRLKKYDSAEVIFKELESDRKFDEWRSFVFAERLKSNICQENDSNFKLLETTSDSTFVGSQGIITANYEYGVYLYKKGDYIEARNYFAKAKGTRSPVFDNAEKLYSLLNTWESKRKATALVETKINNKEQVSDSLKSNASADFFELGRVHEQLGNKDSALKYYNYSVAVANVQKPASARYYYSLAYNLEKSNPEVSDSLYDIIASKHPQTEYGIEARRKLGYTDNFVLDTAADMFKSGVSLRKIKDYNFALTQFKTVSSKYPKSVYAPKSLYSIGWIYENPIKMYDSAYYYYSLLAKNYPETEFAADIKQVMAGVENHKKELIVRDSLMKNGFLDSLGKPTKLMDSLNSIIKADSLAKAKSKEESKPPAKTNDPKDNKPEIKNKTFIPPKPGLTNPLNTITNEAKRLKDIISNPKQQLDSLLNNSTPSDSTNKK